MTTRAATILIAILIVLGLGAYLAMRDDASAPIVNPGPDTYATPSGTSTTTPGTPSSSNRVRVTSPANNALVQSPLITTGEAAGWYFEGSFPLRIIDANGKELGVSYAQAQGDWMTSDFVPFRGTITFATSTTATGFMVFQKDNPSGLPENDAEVRVPIRFAQTVSAQTRNVQLYFYNQNLDKDASGNVLCSAKGLSPVTRSIPLTNTPIQDAVRELLKGPTASERTQLGGTEFPLAGVTLSSASSAGGVLTLTMSDPQNKTTGGSCRVSVLRAQIEATAKQFGGVSSVRFSPNTLFQP